MSKLHLFKARALNVIVILSLALAGLTFSTPTAIADPGPEPLADPTAPSAVGYTPIVGSPLTINVARDGSYQVVHDGVSSSTPGQVYYTGWDEADSGIMLWYDGKAIGPDFDNHGGGTATDNFGGGFHPWEMVSQGSVTGSGTDADPWEVETNLAYQGLVMTTTTSYSDTNDYFDIAWQICPPAPADLSTFLGADLYLQGSDKGYSYFQDRGAIAPGSALVVGGRNYYNTWYELFIELTQADHYHEGRWKDFWQRIGTNQQTPGPGFPDTVGSPTS